MTSSYEYDGDRYYDPWWVKGVAFAAILCLGFGFLPNLFLGAGEGYPKITLSGVILLVVTVIASACMRRRHTRIRQGLRRSGAGTSDTARRWPWYLIGIGTLFLLLGAFGLPVGGRFTLISFPLFASGIVLMVVGAKSNRTPASKSPVSESVS